MNCAPLWHLAKKPIFKIRLTAFEPEPDECIVYGLPSQTPQQMLFDKASHCCEGRALGCVGRLMSQVRGPLCNAGFRIYAKNSGAIE
ncbi:hypothetical protein DFP92_10475 [Yoonia sediminilitoris]|uniref:Uncharacterized protein n=1 Tax=Yoonia sediminilitoris TaxID=1286148 RepID=A0A2T6KIB1_9RHOB|nr:hypothetical protein C8N45_10475 [Yoonia sediminilitoris]RCW96065.1 hypothetical protein DFP92_10475 [Yoonia sediminilitoris]